MYSDKWISLDYIKGVSGFLKWLNPIGHRPVSSYAHAKMQKMKSITHQ
jgi:hypothetical protein